MRRWLGAILCFVLAATAANGGDATLHELAAKLQALRGTHIPNSTYDADPALTPIKQLQKQWVEAQLSGWNDMGDPAALEQTLNRALESAGLVCAQREGQSVKCTESMQSGSDFDARGYLGPLELKYLEYRHFLMLRTRTGIRCGYDESAYVYQTDGKNWRPILATEQDRYDEKSYHPQSIEAVKVSPTGAAWNGPVRNPPVVLTLGYSPWCSSNWQTLFTRAWRVSASPTSLIDRADELFIGVDTIANSRVQAGDVLVEFEGRSVDGDVLYRPHQLHYMIDNSGARRISPFALGPRDYVDEWLNEPWTENVHGADGSAGSKAFRRWYDDFHRGDGVVFGEFEERPLRCRRDQTLWQVGFTRQAGPKNPDLTAHFLVRWMAPYRFAIVDIRGSRFPGCDVVDKLPDALRMLSPF